VILSVLLAPLTAFATLQATPSTPNSASLGGLIAEVVVAGLEAPVGVVSAGDARLFVVEQAGRIRIVSDGQLVGMPFLDLAARVSSDGERGLLGLAFHPSYAANGLFFVNYTREPDGATVISRFRRLAGDPQRADPASEAILLVIPQPFSNHNGGQLQFGPDGRLYVALGDGGAADDPMCNAQRNDSLLGKLLRLDVDSGADSAPFYSVPADNPFVGLGGFADEVWVVGLRNPWRFSFDRTTGDLLIGDVGQGDFEEVNFAPAGAQAGRNYGWRFMEGDSCRNPAGGLCPIGLSCFHPSFTAPVVTYSHGSSDCSITGGYVYRGAMIPDLDGHYLFGDFCSGAVRVARDTGGGWQVEDTGVVVPSLTSFGEDAAGEIYLVSLDSTLRRLSRQQPPEPGTVSFTDEVLTVDEADGAFEVSALRSGGVSGEVSVTVRTESGSAVGGEDFQSAAPVLRWQEGEDGARSATIALIDDLEVEGDESFSLVLTDASGGVTIGAIDELLVTIRDDDPLVLECVPDGATHCLAGGRFRVRVDWRSDRAAGAGSVLAITDQTGAFTFFDPANVELLVKVLDACAAFGHYWVFAAGLTNVGTTLEVTDTNTGQRREYRSALGVAYTLVSDTSAFPTCP
jgi:glucose/arabinose dehydrogenase